MKPSYNYPNLCTRLIRCYNPLLNNDTGFEAGGISIVNDPESRAPSFPTYLPFTDSLYGESGIDYKDATGLYLGMLKVHLRNFTCLM